MDDLLVCRICLIMDVQMYNLRSSPVDNYFECIFGVNPHHHELLTYVCAECAVLINKFYKFREKCITGINLLQDMARNKLEINKKDLQLLDRNHYKLASTNSFGLAENSYFYLLNTKGTDGPWNVYTKEADILNYSNPEDTFYTNDSKEEYIEDTDCDDSKDSDSEGVVNISTIELGKIQKVDPKPGVNILNNNKDMKHIKFDIENDEIIIYKSESEETEGGNLEVTDTNTRRTKSTNKRKKIDTPIDKEIAKWFDVSTQTLEEQKAEIKARKYSAEYRQATHKCSICFTVFVYPKSYHNHMKKHDPRFGPLQCELCALRFQKRKAYARHRLHHSRKFVCKICQRVLHSGKDARFHRDLHTGVTFECKHCLETFSHRTTYLGHLRIKHPSQHICNLCGYSFVNERGLYLHRASMHREITETDVELIGPTCDTCDIQFLDQEAFDRHLVNSSNHNDRPDYKTTCRRCKVPFPNLKALLAHRTQEHPPKTKAANKSAPTQPATIEWPKKCHYCDAMILNARENWFHHRRHHRDQEYQQTRDTLHICEVCGYISANSARLKYHIQEKHSLERPHACAHCPKRFCDVTKYRQHLRAHSRRRPYACSQCARTYKHKRNVQTHEHTAHSGLRPHACAHCGKRFGTATIRNAHVRHVHRREPLPPRRRKGDPAPPAPPAPPTVATQLTLASTQ